MPSNMVGLIPMNPKKVAIVAGSDIDWVSKDDLKSYSPVIGVDHGAFVLLKKGIVPDMAIGDFDSVTKKELREIRKKVTYIKEYLPDKDQTDLELAVKYAFTLNPKEITLFGVTGGRLDQTLAALHLLRIIHKHNCRAVLRNEQNWMSMVSGKYQIQKSRNFSYLSILPCSDEITVTLTGCKYSLEKHRMKKGTTLGMSNVITSDKAEITVHKGIAYVVRSRDQ